MNNIIIKPYSKTKFLSAKPELIGIVNDVEFYEHPRLGDECPLIAIQGEQCGVSEFYELPSTEELKYESR